MNNFRKMPKNFIFWQQISSISSSVPNLQLNTFPLYSLIRGNVNRLDSDYTRVTKKARASPLEPNQTPQKEITVPYLSYLCSQAKDGIAKLFPQIARFTSPVLSLITKRKPFKPINRPIIPSNWRIVVHLIYKSIAAIYVWWLCLQKTLNFSCSLQIVL